MRKGQIFGFVIILFSFIFFLLYIIVLPLMHFYLWTNETPPNALLSVMQFIDPIMALFMIPVILGLLISCIVFIWIGYVLITVPDGQPDWEGLTEEDTIN